jgi:hypothetical protein
MLGTAFAAANQAKKITEQHQKRKKKIGQPNPSVWEERKKQLMQAKAAKAAAKTASRQGSKAPTTDFNESFPSGSFDSPQIIHAIPESVDDMSLLTDDFRTMFHQEKKYGIGEPRFEEGTPHIILETSSMPSSNQPSLSEDLSSGSRRDHNNLLTFQRHVRDGVVRETTLQANCDEGETMMDLVTRLQKSKVTQVLTFTKEDAADIAKGAKKVVFSLSQLHNVKFSKEEFGMMKAAEILGLTTVRPVIINIMTEDVVDGEDLEIF